MYDALRVDIGQCLTQFAGHALPLFQWDAPHIGQQAGQCLPVYIFHHDGRPNPLHIFHAKGLYHAWMLHQHEHFKFLAQDSHIDILPCRVFAQRLQHIPASVALGSQQLNVALRTKLLYVSELPLYAFKASHQEARGLVVVLRDKCHARNND